MGDGPMLTHGPGKSAVALETSKCAVRAGRPPSEAETTAPANMSENAAVILDFMEPQGLTAARRFQSVIGFGEDEQGALAGP